MKSTKSQILSFAAILAFLTSPVVFTEDTDSN